MLLYRYFATHALESLRDVRLKVSRVSSFNDPFECMYYATGEMTRQKARQIIRTRRNSSRVRMELQQTFPGLDRKKIRQLIRQSLPRAIEDVINNYDLIENEHMESRESLLDRFLRVICFASSEAEPHNEILMWSHYSSSHKGVRIGCEFPQENIYPFTINEIIYAEKRVGVDLMNCVLDPSSAYEALKLSNRTKSKSWSYEKEYRLFIRPDRCFEEKDINEKILEFIPIQKEWVKRIDFGTRHPEKEKAPFLELLKKEYPHAECYQAEYHKTDYALEYKRLL